MDGKIFIGTILLEKNRWTTRIPTYRVSEWLERFRQDGFDGIELWENHMLLCDEQECAALESNASPVAIYNSYVGFDNESEDKRIQGAKAAGRLNAKGIKYNFENDSSMLETYIKNLKDWVKLLPEDCRLLCECHADTVMEVPELAGQVLNGLGDERYQAIVHSMGDPNELEKWFQHLGGRITHAHVALRNSKGSCVKLKSNPAQVKDCIRVMKDAGFKGTYTLEFTEGVRAPGENIDDLYKAAVEDLRFLREVLL